MKVLAIDTSCDETSGAVVSGSRVLSHVEYSQVLMYKTWGGVVPSIAKRAHQERIDWVINTCLKRARIAFEDVDAVAVTYGPGLAIALEVGIAKAQEITRNLNIPLIAVNHMEGHLYSPFVQNSRGNPKRELKFPYIGLLVSGGHTELILFKGNLQYEIIGETLDDAAGEALDKAARILGFGYPGGPIIERLARQVDNKDVYHFPRPMRSSKIFNFSFSGLKTALLYKAKSMSERDRNRQINYLASSFQEAVFDSLVNKTKFAMWKSGVQKVLLGGGVAVNQRLRTKLRNMVNEEGGSLLFPSFKYLNFDNASMIGYVGALRAERKFFVKDIEKLERVPRLSLLQSTVK